MRGKRVAVVVGRATATRRHMVWKAVVRRETVMGVVVAGAVSPQMRGRGVGCEGAIGVAAVGMVPPQMYRLKVQMILRGVVIWSGVDGGKSWSASAFRRCSRVPRRSRAGVGRVPNCQRHLFERSDSEEVEVWRQKKKVWERRRLAHAVGAAGLDSISSDSELFHSAVGTERISS